MEIFGARLLDRAIKIGLEYAWQLHEADRIIDRLEASRCVILGIEFWDFSSGQSSPKIMGWTEYDIRPNAGDWLAYVKKSVQLARQAVSNSRISMVNHPIWCQFTWQEEE